MCEALAPLVLSMCMVMVRRPILAGPLIQRNAVAKQGNLYFVQVLLAVAVGPPQLGIVDLDLNREFSYSVLLPSGAVISTVGISLAALFAGMTTGNVL